MRVNRIVLAVALTAVCAAAYAAPPARPLSQQDKTWLATAHQANLAEIKAGKLAERKGHANTIISAGHTLATDHQQLDRKLEPAARKLGVRLPASPTATQQNHMKVFKQRAGMSFDKAWVHMEIGGHIEAIEATKEEIAKGSSPEVKQLAKKALPVLEKHLHILRHVEVEIRGGG